MLFYRAFGACRGDRSQEQGDSADGKEWISSSEVSLLFLVVDCDQYHRIHRNDGCVYRMFVRGVGVRERRARIFSLFHASIVPFKSQENHLNIKCTLNSILGTSTL